MPQFLDLARELRDMIYMAVITWERPRPTLQDAAETWEWDVVNMSQTCHFARARPPSTCANVLVANRQLHEEMMQALSRAREAGRLVARVDCMATDSLQWGSHDYFSWLSIPIVSRSRRENKHHMRRAWCHTLPVVGRLFASPTRKEPAESSSTSIQQLQVDIRLFDRDSEHGPHKWDPSFANTRWDVCAALKRICLSSEDTDSWPMSLTIDTLVLNVLIPPPSSSVQSFPAPCDSDTWRDSARTVARELVDVWNILWSGGEYYGRLYGGLLERIKRVRVCIDGVMVRERELRLELERGQAESKRIAQRVGWR